MDEENNEEDENDYYDNININGILLLKEVISEFFDEEKFLSIMDIGVGNSATCLIYSMINPNISKVVGIDTENPIEFPWNEIQNWKKLDEKKTIEYIKGNIFNGIDKDRLGKIDLCYLQKTLHHLRANDCKFRDEEKKECSLENQKCNIHGCKKAIGNFLPENIFKTLIEYSSHILISEYYYIGKDNDKQDSRGGYLDFDELKKMFEEILQKYKLKFYSPKIDESKDIEEIMNRIKQVNHIAFLVYK